MFKEKLDIDPFRYVTLASLCMAIFRCCFLPEKCMIANEQNKKTSRVCKEWLFYLSDPSPASWFSGSLTFGFVVPFEAGAAPEDAAPLPPNDRTGT